MLKTLYVLPVLFAAGFYTAAPAQALTQENGRSLNGLSFNGLSFNGLSFNGLSFNGLSFNGADREGRVSGDPGQATTVILKDGERVTLH
jgi:hypothetical protein